MVHVTRCPICSSHDLRSAIETRDYSVTGERFNIKACETCQLLITTPRPSELSGYYASDNYISHTSKATNLTDRLFLIARTFTLKNKLALINQFSAKGNLLDYGCGTGHFLNAASKKNWRAYGIEPVRPPRQNEKLTVAQSLEEIPVKDFNAITLWHVLEHIPDLNHILNKLKEHLSETGTIFIAVPNYLSYDAQHYKDTWAGYDVPRHLWHFSQPSMIKLLQKNGLNLISIKPMFLDSIYVSQLSEKYRNNNSFSFKGFITGTFNGIISNIKAVGSKQYSSLIYIVKK